MSKISSKKICTYKMGENKFLIFWCYVIFMFFEKLSFKIPIFSDPTALKNNKSYATSIFIYFAFFYNLMCGRQSKNDS